ncbi:protein phosphatase 2C domain-containing protein [Streptomyces sp. NBC_00525]|uniref:protein phosphatase 2C domain-containing protein n=1 Tax=Streptomyces sp. NBC_00525 TaxID=2903660 RepID=UPI002E81D07A|nr:protein phosphatase 2C domain-containing protein [Streptomyces sp. NBC_00525]WUC96670.1 protein phosphatase 2C domain-containing protein [Streptomyces sp. NBC_00525]
MSQQGERPAAHEDDWWRRLYDESAPDTGASQAADSLDDRFDSASGTVASGPDRAYGTTEVPEERLEPAAPERTPEPEPVLPEPEPEPVLPKPEPEPEPEPVTVFRAPEPAPVPGRLQLRAPWEPPVGPSLPRTFPGPAPEPVAPEPPAPVPDPRIAADDADAAHDEARDLARPGAVAHVGDRPPTYDAEPTALPATDPYELDRVVPDTVLDGASYGGYTLRAASVRGDSARFRGEPRRDALLTARFGSGDGALVLVAVAGASRGAEGAFTASADACRWIGEAVGRSHVRLADDIRAGRRADLKSGLHRLTDRAYGKLRARAAGLGVEPDAYTASLRCLLLSADPGCRTRVFFGIGGGGLFRLRDGEWHDLEPALPPPAALSGDPVVGFGSSAPEGTPESGPEGDRLTMDLGITTGPAPFVEDPLPPPAEPFRFRASVARPGDTLLLCGTGLADPLREEPELAGELAARWSPVAAPGLGDFLADVRIRVKGYADDRTAVGVWEA